MFRRILQSRKKLVIFDFRQFSVDVNENLIYAPETEQKILKVAIIGTPNAGKSTLINHLMDRKACPTSSKVHTTRTKSQAIFTQNNAQVIFLDTPGLVNERELKKHKLEKTFMKDSKSSLLEADMIGVIHDVSNIWTRHKLDIKIINLLQECSQTPSFLVLNKVDLLKSKRKLLDLTRILTEQCIDGKIIQNSRHNFNADVKGWKNFKEVFMVSALNGSGLDSIKAYLLKSAYFGKWLYPSEMWSDQSTENIILTMVKATFLDFLPQEIPYNVKPAIELLECEEEGMRIGMLVHCKTERMCRLIAGANDGRLRQITEVLQGDLQNAFQQPVRIKMVLLPSKG